MTRDTPLVTALGLMSGTSLDGIDAALIRTDGADRIETGGFLSEPYDDGFRARLRAVLGARGPVPEVEAELTDRHAEVVRRLLDRAGLAAADVDVIGFHGHTVLHEPERGLTRQIGDGARLASALGIEVVDGLRLDDVAAGGEGAPLVPVYHRALAAGLERPLAVLNVGGVANVTWIGSGPDDLLAFDTGPGNALLDDWCRRSAGQPFDRDGRLAAAGRVDDGRLAGLLANPYFDRRPPKSLDRDAFNAGLADALDGLGPEDGAALLAAFTVQTVARARDWLPEAPRRWIVVGGGRHNGTLMRGLEAALAAPVAGGDALGWQGDAVEAQAFGYLAVRSRLGLPITFPGTTGVGRPLTGGTRHPAGPDVPALLPIDRRQGPGTAQAASPS